MTGSDGCCSDSIGSGPPRRSPGLDRTTQGPKSTAPGHESDEILQLKKKLQSTGLMKTTTPASAYMKANREVKMKQRAATDRSRSVDPSYRIDPSSYVDPASLASSAEPSAEDLDKGRYEDEVSLCRAICDITAASPCCIAAACRDRPSKSLDRFSAWWTPPEASQPRQG